MTQFDDKSENSSACTAATEKTASDAKVVYVLADDNGSSDSIDFISLWRIIWDGRWIVVGITALFSVVAVSYALLATQWYRADVLLVATDDSPSSIGLPLGDLSGIPGIASLGGSRTRSTEALAVLRSRDFTRNFIEDENLMPVLFSDQWDAEAGEWRSTTEMEQPDIRDGVELFEKQIRNATEDAKTGLITLSIDWTDPILAAEWANQLVEDLNDHMRTKALTSAKENVEYLQEELASTNVATLKESIGNILESELKKLMLARGNEEFSFRVLDSAQVPKEKIRPRRTAIVALATIIGALFAIIAVITGSKFAEPG